MIEDERLEGGCSLALAVMYETAQAEDSPWYGYLQALPVMEDLPVFWTEDEQSLLKGTEMEDAVKNDMVCSVAARGGYRSAFVLIESCIIARFT